MLLDVRGLCSILYGFERREERKWRESERIKESKRDGETQ